MSSVELAAILIIGDGVELKLSVNGLPAVGEWHDLALESIKGIPASRHQSRRCLRYEEESSLLQPIRLSENVEYDFTLRVLASTDKLLEALSEHAFAPFRMDSLLGVASLNSRDSWRQDGETLVVTGRINFRNRAGRADLSILMSGAALEFFVEVEPSKLDYSEDFASIVEALASHHVELLLRLDTGVETSLEMLEGEPSTPLQEMIHLRRLFETGVLEEAVRRIESNPVRKLNSARANEPTSLCADPDWAAFMSSPFEAEWTRSSAGQGVAGGWIPATLPTVYRQITDESKENRFIKHLLFVLSGRLQALSGMISASHTASHFALQRWQNVLQDILSQPFWSTLRPAGVMPNSMALLQRAGYRELIRSFAELSTALALAEIATLSEPSGELKTVYELYETWCFFAFCEAASLVCGSNLTEQIELAAGQKGTLSVAGSIKRKPLKAEFDRGGKCVTINVFYNQPFNRDGADGWENSYSVGLRPDISMSIEVLGLKHWLHFDAKYRLDFHKLNESWRRLTVEDSEESTYVAEDIHVMHTYRDALLGTRGSYVLYPGAEAKPKFFVRHGDAALRKEKNRLPSVGAFPLLPSSAASASQQKELRQFLENAVSQAIKHDFYQEELGFS